MSPTTLVLIFGALLLAGGKSSATATPDVGAAYKPPDQPVERRDDLQKVRDGVGLALDVAKQIKDLFA